MSQPNPDTPSVRETISHRQAALRQMQHETWAILPEHLALMSTLLGAGDADIRVDAAMGRSIAPAGGIALLPLVGAISQRATFWSMLFGGASTEAFGRAFGQAVADESIGAIVIDVDSPGGSVAGVPELAEQIFRARGRKPIVAVANSLAASAAYWIATAADELVVAPSAEVGSVGVIAMHADWSSAMTQAGIDVTFITAGKYKAEGNPYEPLGDEARAAIQARVDDYYAMFIRAVAKQRGVSSDDVRARFGQGRVVGAREAVSLGMADRIETMPETLARLAGRRPSTGAKAGAGSLEVAAWGRDMMRLRRRERA